MFGHSFVLLFEDLGFEYILPPQVLCVFLRGKISLNSKVFITVFLIGILFYHHIQLLLHTGLFFGLFFQLCEKVTIK